MLLLSGCLASGSPGIGESADPATRTDRRTSESRERTRTAKPVPVDSERFELFTDRSDWTVEGGSVEFIDGPSETEGRSIRLTGTGRIQVSRRFDPPIDVRGSRFAATLRSDEDAYPRIQLFDSERNWIAFRAPVRGGLSLQPFDFGVHAVRGDPDLGRITELRIFQSGSERVLLDDIRFHEPPRPGKVAVAFDDGSVTDYTRARPILEEYGYAASTFVNPRRIGNRSNLSLQQLDELAATGWDVCNHTLDHANLLELEDDRRRAQIIGAKEWLVDHGFDQGAQYVAYPYSNYDQEVLEVAGRHHELGFSGGYPATGTLENRLLLPRVEGAQVEAARRAIDLAAAYGGFTCLLFHYLDRDQAAQFEAIVDYLHDRESAGDVDVVTVSDVPSFLTG